MKSTKLLTLSLCTLALTIGCKGGDDAYTVTVEVQPMDFMRSHGSEGSWLETVTAEFSSDFVIAEGEHELEIGEVEIGSPAFELELEAEHSETMFMWNGSDWDEMGEVEDEFHIGVSLADLATEDKSGKLPYSVITADVVDTATGTTVVSGLTLEPMYSSSFHYGGNAALPIPGDYEVTVTAGVPTFARGEETIDMWAEPMVETFSWALTEELEEEIEIGEVERSDCKIELEAEHPESMFMWTGEGEEMHHMEPDAADTAHLEVKLENLDESIRGHEQIPYATINVTILNDETGESKVVELHPMVGGHGFHYGANAALP